MYRSPLLQKKAYTKKVKTSHIRAKKENDKKIKNNTPKQDEITGKTREFVRAISYIIRYNKTECTYFCIFINELWD